MSHSEAPTAFTEVGHKAGSVGGRRQGVQADKQAEKEPVSNPELGQESRYTLTPSEITINNCQDERLLALYRAKHADRMFRRTGRSLVEE